LLCSSKAQLHSQQKVHGGRLPVELGEELVKGPTEQMFPVDEKNLVRCPWVFTPHPCSPKPFARLPSRGSMTVDGTAIMALTPSMSQLPLTLELNQPEARHDPWNRTPPIQDLVEGDATVASEDSVEDPRAEAPETNTRAKLSESPVQLILGELTPLSEVMAREELKSFDAYSDLFRQLLEVCLRLAHLSSLAHMPPGFIVLCNPTDLPPQLLIPQLLHGWSLQPPSLVASCGRRRTFAF
jgi:hypothetical protein